MSGCIKGQAGSQFCDSCSEYEDCLKLHQRYSIPKEKSSSNTEYSKELEIAIDKENDDSKDSIKNFFYNSLNNLNM